MPFGQVVVGPPGSGKTTYCAAAAALLRAAGRRVAVVNLDPANDRRRAGGNGAAAADVDVMDLVCLESVMRELGLGPNGGLLYCMDHLAANLDWLERRLRRARAGGGGGGGAGASSSSAATTTTTAAPCDYFLFDCPGQLELFTLSDSFKRVLDALTGSTPEGRRSAAEAARKADQEEAEEAGRGATAPTPRPPVLGTLRLTAVQLLDAHLCADPSKYVAALVTALSTALRLELPHVAALSKADLLQRVAGAGGEALDFRLDFYTEVQDLPRLARRLDDEAEVEEAAVRAALAAGGAGGDGVAAAASAAAAAHAQQHQSDDDLHHHHQPPLPTRRAFSSRYRKLTAGLCEVVQDYGLLSFTPLSVEDPASLRRLLHLADKASGALYAPLGLAGEAAAAAAAQGADAGEAAALVAAAAAAGGGGGQQGEGNGGQQQQQLAAVAAAVAASGAPAEFLYGAAASGALPMAPDADTPCDDYHERYVLGAWRMDVEAARKRAAEEGAAAGAEAAEAERK
jgi:GTPase SAR1 family protein